MKPSIFLSLVLFLSLTTSSHAIVGGKMVASDDPIARSTVGILMSSPEGMAICTGSLMSATQVLTAGHCAMGTDSKIYIVFSTNIIDAAQRPSKLREVYARKMDRSFYENTLGMQATDHSDIAVLTFTGGVPPGYVPAKLATRELVNQAVMAGSRITLAGYGATDFYAKEGSGVLRKVSTQIDKFLVSGKSAKVGTSSNGACHGDSGGPAIITVGGQNYVFAVTSRATESSSGNCTGRAIYSLIY